MYSNWRIFEEVWIHFLIFMQVSWAVVFVFVFLFSVIMWYVSPEVIIMYTDQFIIASNDSVASAQSSFLIWGVKCSEEGS